MEGRSGSSALSISKIGGSKLNLNDKQLKDLANTPLSELEKKPEPFANAAEQFRKLKAIPIEERVFWDLDPLWKWVAIRKVEREVTAYGEKKIVGAIDASRSQIGEIEAISELCVQKKLAVGQRVMFTNYVLMLPDIEEATGRTDLFLVREEEIYCILRPTDRKRPDPALSEAISEEVAAPEPAPVEAT